MVSGLLGESNIEKPQNSQKKSEISYIQFSTCHSFVSNRIMLTVEETRDIANFCLTRREYHLNLFRSLVLTFVEYLYLSINLFKQVSNKSSGDSFFQSFFIGLTTIVPTRQATISLMLPRLIRVTTLSSSSLKDHMKYRTGRDKMNCGTIHILFFVGILGNPPENFGYKTLGLNNFFKFLFG